MKFISTVSFYGACAGAAVMWGVHAPNVLEAILAGALAGYYTGEMLTACVKKQG